jgi:hypothetical protein
MSERHRGIPYARSRGLAAHAILISLAWLAAGCQSPASTAVPPPQAAIVESHTARATVETAHREAAEPNVERYDIARDERRGGHTLARHVGRSDEDLRDRLRREQISAASTYTDRPTAERVVATALATENARVKQWLARDGQRPNLAIDYHGPRNEMIGRSLARRSARTVPCSDALVVLRWSGGHEFFVLTSDPEAAR